jgi:hypothetical protein
MLEDNDSMTGSKRGKRAWDAERRKKFRKDITELVVQPLAAQRGERARRIAEVRQQILT